jgi:hypothetical protein
MYCEEEKKLTNMYKTTLQLNKDELIDMIERGLIASIEVIRDEEAPPPRVRTSKVHDAIRAALSSGPQMVKNLKNALEAADLSASSLATGLSVLKKQGEVEHVGDGFYGLTESGKLMREAALNPPSISK